VQLQPHRRQERGLAGGTGIPHLLGAGTLEAGTPLSLALTHAPPSSLAQLVPGLCATWAPLKGGTLVPSPDILLPALPLDAGGALLLESTWPAGLPPGTSVFIQAWVADPAGPQGFAASGALRASAP